MKTSQRRKALIPFFSIFLLIFVNSASSAQTNQTPGSKIKTSQEIKPTANSTASPNTRTFREAVQVTQKDGSQRIVPVITGEVLWWIILTVLCGTLIAISVIVILSAFSSRKLQSGEKDQYLSEALPTLIEGITIVYIVLAVLLLSILGITSAEGTLSILAGISGYVLGKERAKHKLSAEAEPSKNDPAKEDGGK
jgi:ABC-type phosphate/phosphonate transport system permease subunit